MDINTLGGFLTGKTLQSFTKYSKLESSVLSTSATTKISDSNAVSKPTNAYNMETSMLQDMVGIFPFGMQQRSSCKSKKWGTDLANHKLLRNIILRAQDAPGDDKTDLKVCVPAMIVDAQGSTTVLGNDLQNRAAILQQQIASPEAAKALISGLSTEESAILYGIEGKISYAGTNIAGKALFKLLPEKGKAFQEYKIKFKGTNGKLFKTSACGLRAGVGKMQVNMMKKINFAGWRYLKEHHVIADCQDDSNYVKIYVQVPEEGGGASARTDIKAAYEANGGDDAVLELLKAGIDTENQPDEETAAEPSTANSGGRRLVAPTTADLDAVEINPTLQTEITVEGDGLDTSTLDIMRESGLAPEADGSGDVIGAVPLWAIILLIVLGTCCICMCVGGAVYILLYLPYKKDSASATTNEKQQPAVEVINPSENIKPIEVQAVPVM
jgi:hypothetical protein